MAQPGTQTKDKKSENLSQKKSGNSQSGSSQSDEAKELLAKMEAKKDAGDCPFC